jgi:putative glycosyltransferase
LNNNDKEYRRRRLMKILHIPTGGLFSDGIGTFIYSYLEYMNLNEIEVTILATNKPLLEDKIKFKALGVQVVEIERKKSSILAYMRNFLKLLKTEKYDIVHVHGSSALMSVELSIAKIMGVPVRIAHSHNTTCNHILLDRILRPFFNTLYTQSWACGVKAGEWLFKNKQFKVIHNARDVEKYRFNSNSRQIFREMYSLKENVLTLGHVGRFNIQKNHLFLLDLMDELNSKNKNVKLFLVGEGEKIVDIKNDVKLRKLEDSIVFLNRYSDMQSFVSAMDIMLLPSLYEGLPLVAIEWQINGVQSFLSTTISDECVFTNSIQQLPIDNVNIWVKAIEDFSYIDRIEKSIQNIDLAQKSNYDIRIEAKNLENMYKKLVEE